MHFIFHSCITCFTSLHRCIHIAIYGFNNHNVLNIGHSGIKKKIQDFGHPIHHWYNTRAKLKRMAEESDAKIERLEKASQDQQGQMAEMMEMLRTLVREQRPTANLSPQNETAHHEQKREENTYPTRFTPPYGPTIHIAPSMPQT